MMRTEPKVTLLLGLLAVLLFLAATGFVGFIWMLLWNYVVVALLAVQPISWPLGCGLALLLWCLGGNFRGKSAK